MNDPIPSLNQHQHTLLQTLATALQQVIDLEMQNSRGLSLTNAGSLFAYLGQILTGIGGEMIATSKTATPSEPALLPPPADDSRFETERREAPPAPTDEKRPNSEHLAPLPAQVSPPKPTLALNIERYLALEEDGKYVAGKRTSRSRWIIFGLLLPASGGRVPLATLVQSVPAWAALLQKQDEPDEGAIKRMLSKMNTLDLQPLGVPYRVKTKKDRKTGIVYVFMADLTGASSRGYGRP